MALSKTITANGSRGNHKFTLYVEETTTSGNYSYLSFTFKLSPIHTSYDWSGWGSKITYTITINGVNYTGKIPSYDGYATVTLKSGSNIAVEHESDGTKTINLSFSVTDSAGQSYTCGNASASGAMDLTILHLPPEITNVTIAETDARLTAISLDDDIIVSNLSQKQFTITAVANDGATISTYNVYYNDTLVGTSSSNIVNCDFRNITIDNGGIVFEVIDSLNAKGYFNTLYSIIEYIKPTLTNTTIKRRSDSTYGIIDGHAYLNITGNFYAEDNIVGNNNTITKVEYKIWNTTEPSYTNVTNDATIGTNDVTLTNYDLYLQDNVQVDFDKVYTYKVVITDYFGNTSEVKVGTVSTGLAVWTEYKDRVDFYNITRRDNEIFSNEYSNNEIIVGKWTDGKPIYRKVYETTTTSGDNQIAISNISSNIDTITKIDGTTVQSNNNIIPINYYHSSTDWANLYYKSSNPESIIIRCGSSYGYGSVRLIVEYTKTTD